MKDIPAFPERVEYKSCNATIYCHKNRNSVRYEVKSHDVGGSKQRVTFLAYASAKQFAEAVVV